MASSGLDQIKFLTNSFSDQRVTGPESYDKAKTQLASDDWEMEVKGLEMIVSISRSRPDVKLFFVLWSRVLISPYFDDRSYART